MRTFLIEYRAKFKDHIDYIQASSSIEAMKKIAIKHNVKSGFIKLYSIKIVNSLK